MLELGYFLHRTPWNSNGEHRKGVPTQKSLDLFENRQLGQTRWTVGRPKINPEDLSRPWCQYNGLSIQALEDNRRKTVREGCRPAAPPLHKCIEGYEENKPENNF